MRLKRISSVVIISILALGSTFAQETANTQACSTTPEVIESYIDFITKAAGILGDDYEENKVSHLGPFSHQFVSGNKSLKKSNFLNTLYKSHKKRLQESLLFLNNTKKVLVKNIVGTLDARTRQQVSLYTPALKRDLDKIAKLDPLLDNISLALGRAGISNQSIQAKTQDELTQLIQTHTPNLLQSNNTIKGASYDTIIKLLNRMQSQIKQAIVLNNNNKAINNDRLIIKSNSIILAISDQAKQEIVDGYKAVREQSCNSSVDKTKNAFGKARQQGVQDMSNSTREFVRGRKTLKYFFAGKSNNLNTQEENIIKARIEELERSRRGYKSSDGNFSHFPKPTYRNNFKDILRNSNTIQKNEKKIETIIKQNTNTTTIIPSDFKERLAESINQLQSTIYTDNLILTVAEPQDQTQTIADTVKVIKRAQDILEIYEENLATTCELQCNNKGGVCRAN